MRLGNHAARGLASPASESSGVLSSPTKPASRTLPPRCPLPGNLSPHAGLPDAQGIANDVLNT